jgi:hypothetical protein
MPFFPIPLLFEADDNSTPVVAAKSGGFSPVLAIFLFVLLAFGALGVRFHFVHLSVNDATQYFIFLKNFVTCNQI